MPHISLSLATCLPLLGISAALLVVFSLAYLRSFKALRLLIAAEQGDDARKAFQESELAFTSTEADMTIADWKNEVWAEPAGPALDKHYSKHIWKMRIYQMFCVLFMAATLVALAATLQAMGRV